MTEPRSPAIIYAKGDRRPGRGARLLMITGGLIALAATAAIAWMAHGIADNKIRPLIPMVLYREPWLLEVAQLAGVAAVLAGAGALRAGRRLNRRSRR